MRPLVTLTYAQSLDGSLAAANGSPLRLSGPESMQMTHQLRATHDAILVGVNTVINDDPKLTTKIVNGVNPQPIVVDSHLRIPLTAQLLKHPSHRLWVAATAPLPERITPLEALGAQIIRVEADAQGRVQLAALLDQLGELGIKTLMVEGGARVIQSFLEQRLAQKLIITIAPQLVGGLKVLEALPTTVTPSRVQYRQLGPDLIVEADLET